MATNTTPVFSEVAVLAAQSLAKGSIVRGTIDLTAYPGAYILPRIGRGGTTALGTAISVLIRRVYGGSSGTRIHPASGQNRLGGTTAAASTTCATSDSNSGQSVLTVSSGTGFAAGDLLCIADAGLTRTEFGRIAKISAAVITLDAPLQYTHTSAAADTVRNQSDVFTPIWCPGGALWEVIFDYGASASGETVVVEALAQKYTSDITQ